MVYSGVNAGSILLKNAINNGEDETECTHGNFVDNAKLVGLANTPDGFAICQRGLDKLVEKNFMKFNKGKKFFLLGRNSSIHQYTLGEKKMKIFFPGKDLAVLEDNKLTMSEQCVLVGKKAPSESTAKNKFFVM